MVIFWVDYFLTKWLFCIQQTRRKPNKLRYGQPVSGKRVSERQKYRNGKARQREVTRREGKANRLRNRGQHQTEGREAMSNLAEVIPYDEQARRYFGITKYRTEAQEEAAYEHECQKEMKALREELHPLLEEVGDGFLFENDRVQAKMVDIIRDRAAKIVAICEDHADIEGNGI